MANPFCPARGDVVWLDFDPQVGHEQAGRRPALVLSHRQYNRKSGLAIVCPMTSKTDKPWPFLVQIDAASAVISDQVKCVDWRGRRAQIKDRLPAHVLDRVVAIFCRLILLEGESV
jgi:mRNA interferase MazF